MPWRNRTDGSGVMECPSETRGRESLSKGLRKPCWPNAMDGLQRLVSVRCAQSALQPAASPVQPHTEQQRVVCAFRNHPESCAGGSSTTLIAKGPAERAPETC